MQRLLGAVGSVCLAAMGVQAAPSPFADAVAVWHLGNSQGSGTSGGELRPVGAVALGVPLEGEARAASLARGGDGLAARFEGGYLDAGQGAGGALNLQGHALSVCIRLRDPLGTWNCPLFSKHGGHERLLFNVFSADLGEPVIGLELGTEGTKGMTQVAAPLAGIGPTAWHDVIARYDGAKLQLFVDGVLMDEGFPMGALRAGNTEPCLLGAESAAGQVKSGFRGLIDHVALWQRALTDAEVEMLSGGRAQVAARTREILGDLPSPQYWKPHNQFNVGDTLPFFHDGVFHFYYLQDRGHHTAKGHFGAHQWAHASSRDLVHWQRHPLAVPITREEEGSICTGSLFFHAGTWYAFYATRVIGKGEQLSLALSPDGIHFSKSEPNPFLLPKPEYTGGFRDPHVFRDERTGLFHLLVSTLLKQGKRGCLAHYTSTDLKEWRDAEPFLIEGSEVPECPDYFAWNGWYYLLFSNRQVAHYRLSRSPLGPWEKPAVDVLDGNAARVMKTAAFTGNRRLGTASIWPHGYAGWAVFRELVQHPDGTLGTRFVPEMVPRAGKPVALRLAAPAQGVYGDGRSVRLSSVDDRAEAALAGMPANALLRMEIRPRPGVARFGLGLHAGGAGGPELLFDPGEQRVDLTGGEGIAGVGGLDRPFRVELVLKEHLLDVCVAGRRTLVNWLPETARGPLALFVEKGEAAFEKIEVRPLLP